MRPGLGRTATVLKYKLVIFDIDGTLADSFSWFVRVINDVADQFRFRHVAPDEVETLRGCDARTILQRLEVPKWKLPMIARHMRALKARHLHEIGLFPGVDRLLRELAEKDAVLAVVSSDSESNVRRTLGPANAQRIAFYACGASLFGKRAKFAAILKRSHILATQAIAIGDEIRDAEAARRAGIAFGAVSWGYATVESLRSVAPEHVFSTIDDVLAKLA
jgi:phosphoglycolate phosphatase